MGVEVTVSPNGRVSIPADVRKQLGIDKGGKLMLDVDEYGVRLSTFKQRLARTQALFREMQKGKPPISVDEFIAEKRADAQAEKY
jgi:AbrB family looped-hinge helix DNA binding protein